MVQVAQLGIAFGKLERLPIVETEPHAVLFDGFHFGHLPVDETGAGIVAHPADTVSGTEFHRLAAVDLDPGLPPISGPALKLEFGVG